MVADQLSLTQPALPALIGCALLLCGAIALRSGPGLGLPNQNGIERKDLEALRERQVGHSRRLCTQNQYADALGGSLEAVATKMDMWLSDKTSIEREVVSASGSLRWDHSRFLPFNEVAKCKEVSCVGGPCSDDTSKQVCGLSGLAAPCTVYSIGGNNRWEFELDILAKTPCDVHTFDCTGPVERFEVPSNDKRMHFHHLCLGARRRPAPVLSDAEIHASPWRVVGETWTLEEIQTELGHPRIDLFKMDIEGYEWPIFETWPNLFDVRSATSVLPMQVLVEVHYKTQMGELAEIAGRVSKYDYKFPTDMVQLQSHFLKMGYAVVIRDDNPSCPGCTELTLVRVRCPEDMAV